MSSKDSTVNELNCLLQPITTHSHIDKSTDTVVHQDKVINYLTELLNSLEPLGLSPRRLELKVRLGIIFLPN